MTSNVVSPRKKTEGDGRQLSPEQAAAAAMVAEAKARGLELTGPNGLLKLFTKNVLETALNEEMTEHLGHEKNQAEPGRESSNVRNGSRGKTVVSDAAGEVRIEVPRYREGTFDPQIVKKRQRRLTEVDEIVLSLYAKGMTTGEISAHFAEIDGASVSKETVSRITDKVVAEMTEWSTRPLDRVYAAVFIDVIMVKVRDGQVANRPVYAAIGVTVDGRKDVLGLWAIVQTCIIHLIRNTFRLTSRTDADAIKRDIKPIYTAVNADAAAAALDDLEQKWGPKYRAMIRLWRNAWNEFIPFLDYDAEIRKVICSTNAIESLNARYRRAVRARGHFPSEQAVLKCLYLVTRSLDPTGTGRARWTMRWLSRHRARCRHCCRSVSPCRSPNPPCVSPRNGLSTVAAVRPG